MTVALDWSGIALAITAVAGLVSALGAYLNGRAIAKVHTLADGMSTRLNVATAQVSRQEGFEAGQAQKSGVDQGRGIEAMSKVGANESRPDPAPPAPDPE